MKEALREILIFAGTTEGRALSEYLAGAGIRHTVCVATEYGGTVLKQHPLVKVHQGRMGREEIRHFLMDGAFAAVADATHPFAKDITCNIQAAIKDIEESREPGTTIPYLRLKRDSVTIKEDGMACFETHEACAKALEDVEGNILLTCGSRNLSWYCNSGKLKDRLYVRALPDMDSLSRCMEQGICGKRIIAMQGPFTAELNEALIRQYKISCLVTKESGVPGGFLEKLEAAERTGIPIYVIGRPEESGGYSFSEICGRLEEISGKKSCVSQKHDTKTQMLCGHTFQINLIGIGMGHEACLTKEAEREIQEADIVLGAERLLENLCPKPEILYGYADMPQKPGRNLEMHPYYQAEQIIPYLLDIQEKNLLMEKGKIAVLFSGDSGFYSGCQSLYAALRKEIEEGRLHASLRILPGISSVAYLASCIGESYQDAAVYSIHGKKLCNLARRIKNSPKTFLLTSGVRDINDLGKLLTEAGMTECEVVLGYQLSYQEQRIEKCTLSGCCERKEEGLYTCFIKNPYAEKRKLTHGMADGQFIRDQVPMTKEEVREVSICKLRLHDQSVVYDIGSGTGSAAIEIAGLSDNIQVYALERRQEAVSLIERNKKKSGLQNVAVVEAEAPEGFRGLPMATHAFIGGSNGRLKEILAALRQINPEMRVVVSAVSMETVCEMREILSMDGIREEEVIQLQVSRVKKAGNHHLVKAENPVWICAFYFGGVESKKGGMSE